MSNSQPDSTDASSRASRTRLLSLYGRVKDEIDNIVENDVKSQKQLLEVNSDLSISKRAYASLEAEYASLKASKEELEKQRDNLLTQIKPNRIVVLVDGDGAIFNLDLIAEGIPGGQKAASRLSETIKQQYPNRAHLDLAVYVFLNKHGLAAKFGRINKHDAKHKLNEFIVGFNQASERFLIADVGYAKEGADAKIKAFLEAEIRLPQTESIVFAGCHDNGYVTALRSHITSGFKHKLVLLQSYHDIANGMRDLDLPLLVVPGLFIPNNLDVLQTPSIAPADLPPPRSPAIPFQPIPPTPKRTVIRNRAPSRAESSTGPGDGATPSESSSSSGLRPINRALPLHAQTPPLCLMHYLSPTGCKKDNCKFAHDYGFNSTELNELRKKAKSLPCTSMLKGRSCAWGDACVYGHKCPFLDKCSYNKKGKCKFSADGMHSQ